MIKRLRRKLSDITAPPATDNFEHNRSVWDSYAQNWDLGLISVEDSHVSDAARRDRIRTIGDEWGTVEDTQTVFGDFIAPYLGSGKVVAEIGSGGGRIALKVADLVGHLTCYDISSRMLAACKRKLAGRNNVDYVLLQTPGLPAAHVDKYDFIYSFDVFVHLDLHLMWRYIQGIRSCLKPGGEAFLHTANLAARGGWDNFVTQDRYQVLTHYYVTPQTIEMLVARANLTLTRVAQENPGNFYYNRDYLCIVQKTS